jgi:hypothetical protein
MSSRCRERHGAANTRLSLVQHHRQNPCNGYCGLVLILALGAGVHVEFHNNTRHKQHSPDSVAGRKSVDITISILILAAPLIAAVLIRDW